MKEYNKLRSSETANDPPVGRRNLGGDYLLNSKPVSFHGFKSDFSSKYGTTYKSNHAGKRHFRLRKHLKSIVLTFAFMGFLVLLDSFMVSIFDSVNLQSGLTLRRSSGIKVQQNLEIHCL